MNLYQKYRPRMFGEVIGHEKTIKDLKKRSVDKAWPQVIFLTGPTGVGKTTIARIIAKAITCSNPDADGDPCNQCKYCNDVNKEGFSLACYTYNGGDMGIEQVRNIKDQATMRSITSRYKVFFIDEIQEMGGQGGSKKAQKDLLDVLEKVSKNNFFILGAMDDTKVDPAIKNRSVMYRLHEIAFDAIAQLLYDICLKEDVPVDKDENIQNALVTIAENCNGSMRTAISYLDRCVTANLWDQESLWKELSLADSTTMVNMIGKILSGDITALEEEITKDNISKLRYLLNMIYKKQAGLELNTWQQKQIKGLANLPKANVRFTIKTLNELQQYNYITQQLIDFLLIECIENNRARKEVLYADKPKMAKPNEVAPPVKRQRREA